MHLIRSAWQFRIFIVSSIVNELRIRFAGSRFGATWMILQPLAQVAVFAFILSGILSAKLPGVENTYAYAIYLSAGVLAWSLFAEIISRCLTMFIDNASLIKKVSFPKITLPLIIIGTSIVNHTVLFLVIMAIFSALGHFPGVHILWLPLLMLVMILLASGIGIILGIFNVFIRDTGQLVPIVLQFLFWFTPIVYPVSIVPESLRHVLWLNPVYHLTNAYQGLLVYNSRPEITPIVVLTFLALGILGLSLVLFRKASMEMADAL
ncbi:ABC-2 type transporter [Desulfurispirillum indicum S5]|uniref:Transport permease protein n=2 Tax=Desulfurispirillum TaxID=393029 RepID=E6W640_DESIS|nr:ABC transporter permease [Desulfurispirillum indicum]ADU64979.1 ABC-2 type transporter [Desulfurispirillum indicum S5]